MFTPDTYTPSQAAPYSLEDLLYLMARLRKPVTGCPWDLKQSYRSIVPSTLEEAYEVVDAIERDDFKHLPEELGDLLFQVVFYSQLGREDGRFDFADVVSTLVDKLLRRHPHVFPSGLLQSEISANTQGVDSVKKRWEDIQEQERAVKGQSGVLDDVPVGLPALTRAQKLQKRAARVGFDWPSVDGVKAKIMEEFGELSQALTQNDASSIEDEMGDLLFTVVNFARHIGVDAESALRRSSQKFQRRFTAMENLCGDRNLSLEDATPEQMDLFWQQVKQGEVSSK